MDATESTPTYDPTDRNARRGWGLIGLVEASLVIGALTHPISKALARHSWVTDLVTHFQGPALVATLIAAFVNAFRHRRIAAALCVLAAFQVVPLFRYAGRNPVLPAPGSSDRLRIVVMNLLDDNVMHEDAIHLIRTERPDVLGLVEYTPTWYFALAGLHKEYPYRIDAVGGANGLALWFRKPPMTLDPPTWPLPEGWPMLHATFAFAGKPRHIWLVHPRSPLKPERRIAGFPELAAIGAVVGATPGSRIVVGDFNTTDGSPFLHDFERASGLRDSRLGFGKQGSWPTRTPYRIAIDHALVSDDLAVADRRLGHWIGSDHFPVVVDLAPAAIEDRSASATAPQRSSGTD